jgi:predicted NAD/FAD-dependent oxidoreductase
MSYRHAKFLVPLALAASTGAVAAGGSQKVDVVIVGAGSGGVSAAIQAARLGASVALVEETDWIGGQMTAAGVSTMDEGHYNEDSGLYAEFISRVKTHYDAIGKSIGTCYWSARTHCFEPSVGQKILYAMIESARPGRIEGARQQNGTSTKWPNFSFDLTAYNAVR